MSRSPLEEGDWFLLTLDWQKEPLYANSTWKTIKLRSALRSEHESCHPIALSTKANADDHPKWNEAVNGPDAEGFWEAMDKEIYETMSWH